MQDGSVKHGSVLFLSLSPFRGPFYNCHRSVPRFLRKRCLRDVFFHFSLINIIKSGIGLTGTPTKHGVKMSRNPYLPLGTHTEPRWNPDGTQTEPTRNPARTSAHVLRTSGDIAHTYRTVLQCILLESLFCTACLHVRSLL